MYIQILLHEVRCSSSDTYSLVNELNTVKMPFGTAVSCYHSNPYRINNCVSIRQFMNKCVQSLKTGSLATVQIEFAVINLTLSLRWCIDP